MLDADQRTAIVDRLIESHRTRRRCLQPSASHPHIELADAYAIASQFAECKKAQGIGIAGHKIGLTSKAMQRTSTVDEPDYGYVFEDLVLNSGASVDFNNFCQPRVEPELTFVLHSPLQGPGLGLLDVLRATEYVFPSIEIIDARVADPRTIVDTVADNAAAAGIVLGGSPVRPGDIDLRWCGAILSRNGEIEETGLAAGVLGHPALAIAWLGNRLSRFGTVIEAGKLLLSGSFTRPIAVCRGDTFTADFGPLGNVAIHFR